MTPSAKQSQPPGNFSPEKLGDVLWESAAEAVVQTILILVMGGLALDLVGDLFHDMIPSPPPGLAGAAGVEAESSATWRHWRSSFTEYQFPIVFALLFILLASRRLFVRTQTQAQSKAVSRIQKIGRRLSEDWFTLIVGNAFGAMVCAMVLVWTQTFSLPQMLWGWFVESILPGFHKLAEQLFGANRVDAFGRLFSWYGENQIKFDFWFIYFASVCDDLGLPNLKTLARFLWRRLRNWNRATPPSPALNADH